MIFVNVHAAPQVALGPYRLNAVLGFEGITMIEFFECANYRGPLQAKEEDGRYYWRVDSDIDEEPWNLIPEFLWQALNRYHEETAEQRKPQLGDDEDEDEGA